MGYGFGLWFCGFVVWFLHRKIRLTQLWVELSWVVAKITFMQTLPFPRVAHAKVQSIA